MTEPVHQSFTPSTPLVLGCRVVDLDAGILRDANGASIALRPQAWAVLALLLRQRGKVVTKTQLLDTVWAGRVVTDASLARAVSDLRTAFGSDGHRIIRTAARRGYLLVAPVEPALDRGLQRTAPLPAARGPLFGRAADLADLCALMARHRLVTIVGAGGVGKTAIAVAAARSLAVAPPSKAAWVDLAQLADPQWLVATVARSLGLPTAQGADQLTGLLAALAPLSAWLVLDNAEHLVAGVARLVRAMLDAAPGLRVLVTSQAPLHIEAEHVFRLTPLDVPALGASLADAAGSGAVALFVDQARALDRHFELGPANLGLVIELCRRLEGLPLAIRLAAARLPLLGLAAVASRLNDRLQLLAAHSREAPTRQQTLLAALDWSCSLLGPQEQTLFRRLGVFVGGFSLGLAVGQATASLCPCWGRVLCTRPSGAVWRCATPSCQAPPGRRFHSSAPVRAAHWCLATSSARSGSSRNCSTCAAPCNGCTSTSSPWSMCSWRRPMGALTMRRACSDLPARRPSGAGMRRRSTPHASKPGWRWLPCCRRTG